MGIKRKITISLSLILISLGIALNIIISKTLISNMEENVYNSLNEIMKSTEQYVRYRLIVDEVGLNTEGLLKSLDYLSKNISLTNDCKNRISDMKGKTLQNSISNTLNDYVNKGIETSKKGKAVVYLKYNNKNLSGILSFPLYESGEYIGIITISKDYSNLYKSSSNIILFITIIEITIFLSIFFLIFFIIGKIIKPISLLTSAVKEVGDGKYDINIKVTGKDEIGILSREFINMKNKIKEQMITIQREKEKVEKLENSRREFFNNVTHELKTPLTSISGYAQMLESGMVDDEAFNKRAIERIYSESERLHTLVLELIDISKGKTFVKEEAKEISMFKLLNEICDDMCIKAKKYSISITRNIDDGIIFGQINKIRELAINIIDNAIKYSADSYEITINGKVEDDFYKFEVINRAEPIPEEVYKNVFKPFVKSDKSKDKQSFGLGLYICSEILKEHNGQIEIENGSLIKVKVKIPCAINKVITNL